MTTDQLLQTTSPPTLAYLLTWAAHGTTLQRKVSPGTQTAASAMRIGSAQRPVSFSVPQREVIEDAIRDCCEIQGWNLVAVTCRSNHAHALVNAAADPDEVLLQLQVASSQQLNATGPQRETWWEAGGNVRSLANQNGLDAAAFYVRVILTRM